MTNPHGTPPVTFKTVPIDSLHEDPANARAHGAENRRVVRASLKEFGQVEALVVTPTGRVIGGNCRLGELKAMGVLEVQVAEVALEGVDAARLGLVLNRSAELATWDEDGLEALLKELDADDLAGDLGWDEEGLDLLLKGADGVGDDEWGATLGELSDEDRAPFQEVSFRLHDDQAVIVKEALAKAKDLGPFGDTGNENSNGNALVRICEMFHG